MTYVAHEGLLLDYEDALTRLDAYNEQQYSLSSHLIWIGERTRNLEGAHMEFFSKVQTPLGIKIGPCIKKQEFVDTVRKLNPKNDPSKLVVYPRLGKKKISEVLHLLIDAKKENGLEFIWVCDPMHGNTFQTENGFKSRRFADLMEELR